MASIIKIKRSTTPGSAPASLSAGEIAVNIPDRMLFVGDGSSIYRIGAQYLSVANAVATYQTIAIERAALANTNAYIATRASWAGLTGTNTALRTLISDRLQVANAVATYQTIAIERAALANTNSYIATKASWGSLTGTNTALRTLISDRLQVANAVATYQTISIERAALANTNSYIATKLNSTNPVISGTLTANGSVGSSGNFLRSTGSGIYWDALPSQTQYLQVANAIATYAVKVNPSTSGFFNHTGRLTVGTNLRVSGNTIIDGDLTVEGAVTYISSSTLNVDDSMIKLAANNVADTVDVGFYGKYVSSGTKYSGLFRDASDGVFKFYTGSQTEPTTTVDTGAIGYTVGTIEASIDGGTY